MVIKNTKIKRRKFNWGPLFTQARINSRYIELRNTTWMTGHLALKWRGIDSSCTKPCYKERALAFHRQFDLDQYQDHSYHCRSESSSSQKWELKWADCFLQMLFSLDRVSEDCRPCKLADLLAMMDLEVVSDRNRCLHRTTANYCQKHMHQNLYTRRWHYYHMRPGVFGLYSSCQRLYRLSLHCYHCQQLYSIRHRQFRCSDSRMTNLHK
jgi:hypothetical protein